MTLELSLFLFISMCLLHIMLYTYMAMDSISLCRVFSVRGAAVALFVGVKKCV